MLIGKRVYKNMEYTFFWRRTRFRRFLPSRVYDSFVKDKSLSEYFSCFHISVPGRSNQELGLCQPENYYSPPTTLGLERK